MKKKYFFDIPVYRLSINEYDNECNNKIMNSYQYFFIDEKGNKKNKLITFNNYHKKAIRHYDIWEFNEIIGFIRLYILGTQIRGEYYQHKSSRIRKTRTKSFTFKTHKLVPEINILNKTNEEVYNIILDYLENSKLELKRRFIDIETFKYIGQFIDWNKLIHD